MHFTALTDPLNLVAGVTMALIGTFGIVCNSLIVYIFVRSPTERSSFNLVCVCRAVCNCLILSWAFMATFVPMTLLDDSLFSPIYQTIVIISVNSTYTGIQFCGTFIAINRFCAMYLPILYSKVFNIRHTSVIMVFVAMFRVVSTVVECEWNIENRCYSIFSTHYLRWLPENSTCLTVSPSMAVDLTGVGFMLLVFLNLATCVKIYFFYKKVELGQREMKRRMRRNRVMFLQTVLQDFIFLIDMFFTFVLSELRTERYWTFLSGSFVWQSVHCVDGLIMIMCNERLTLIKNTLFPSSSNPSIVPKVVFTASVAPSRID